jgi:hypothetical protein
VGLFDFDVVGYLDVSGDVIWLGFIGVRSG